MSIEGDWGFLGFTGVCCAEGTHDDWNLLEISNVEVREDFFSRGMNFLDEFWRWGYVNAAYFGFTSVPDLHNVLETCQDHKNVQQKLHLYISQN